MALKIPLHFKWAFPSSSKRTALGWTRPRYEKDLLGGRAPPPGAPRNPLVWAESAVPCPTSQVSVSGGGQRRKAPPCLPAAAQHLAQGDPHPICTLHRWRPRRATGWKRLCRLSYRLLWPALRYRKRRGDTTAARDLGLPPPSPYIYKPKDSRQGSPGLAPLAQCHSHSSWGRCQAAKPPLQLFWQDSARRREKKWSKKARQQRRGPPTFWLRTELQNILKDYLVTCSLWKSQASEIIPPWNSVTIFLQ